MKERSVAHTIFLAGAAGAIGRPLAMLLVRDGHRVIGTTRSAAKADEIRDLGIEPVMLDVYDGGALRRALVAAAPDIVMHQLTDLPAGMRTDDMPSALARNTRLRIEGTANLVTAAIAAGTVRRMIAQSLAFAYAAGPLPRGEEAPIHPEARGVLSLEAQVMAAPFEGVILRYGRLWGPGTGFDLPQDAPSPVHVEAAAQAARLAVEQGAPGAYNIAEETGDVSSEKARRELRWDQDFRVE